MIDKESDATRWTKEKLLQTNGDTDFLTEKVAKWIDFGFYWENHADRCYIGLTDSIQEKMNNGTTIEEWLNTVYSPLDATILAASVVTGELVAPLITEKTFHEENISCAIYLVDVNMTMPTDKDRGAFSDICEPDTLLFPHDVTLLDIINILDREVAKNLYADEQR